MMARGSRGGPEQSVPTSFTETTPPLTGTDLSMWLLTAHAKMEATLARVEATLTALQTQMGRVESKLGDIEKEVAGHGKWMHTLKAFAGVVLLLIGWLFVNAFWPWFKARLASPTPPSP